MSFSGGGGLAFLWGQDILFELCASVAPASIGAMKKTLDISAWHLVLLDVDMLAEA